ncbi:hypothetical protein [Clostridium chrysemydis]|uniref:hypothetical protein n=1 Tax=Clostridium chrysemydis TaxID=2665504 RepID=UPI0018843564|nr:hypothetical protein [Clostridium chrysemydis]
MLKLSFLEIILRTIPESLLFVLVPYIISTKKIEVRNYFKSVLILSISVAIIRMFPISYGIHTLLNLVILVILFNLINHIEIDIAIKSVIFTTILLLISEGANLLVLKIFFSVSQINNMFKEPLYRMIIGFPSIIFFGVALLILYWGSKRKQKYGYYRKNYR